MICLDWTGSEHWSPTPGPCHLCGRSTHLLDDAGRHAHKVCVERALTAFMNNREMTA